VTRFYGERVSFEIFYDNTAAVCRNRAGKKILVLHREGLVRRLSECSPEDLEDAIRVVSKTEFAWLQRRLMELV
jgi:hypothetical protein